MAYPLQNEPPCSVDAGNGTGAAARLTEMILTRERSSLLPSASSTLLSMFAGPQVFSLPSVVAIGVARSLGKALKDYTCQVYDDSGTPLKR